LTPFARLFPAAFILGQLIPKGYITLDGTSLTLTGIRPAERQFSVMLIAHTQEKVVMTRKQVGDRVNVECDAVGKWVLAGVEGALAGLSEGMAAGEQPQGALAKLVEDAVERVVERKLREKGLI
jgi:riboflavin synthase